MNAKLARTTSRTEFIDKHNPIRIVSKRNVMVWAISLEDGTYRIQIPQTGLNATVTAAALHFAR